jgi:alkyl sulfatase BDS1-like metallo-beta-lactamase superfamily hydrolase
VPVNTGEKPVLLINNLVASGLTVIVDGVQVPFAEYIAPRHRAKGPFLFYIPAQRVLTLANG